MYTHALFTTALLAAASVAAEKEDKTGSGDQADPADQILTKLNNVKSFALKYTAAASAYESFLATQTAVPHNENDTQDGESFDAYLTATETALPAYLTALPSSLQHEVSSLAVEAGLIKSNIVAMVPGSMASDSSQVAKSIVSDVANANSANSTAVSTSVGPVTTSGMPRNSANATAKASNPTTSPNPTASGTSNGAGSNGVFVAAGVLAVGLAGVMSLL